MTSRNREGVPGSERSCSIALGSFPLKSIIGKALNR